jgi:hypothetical protein
MASIVCLKGTICQCSASIAPIQGSLIYFDHDLWHDGQELSSGEKFIMRSDILYERIEAHGICSPDPRYESSNQKHSAKHPLKAPSVPIAFELCATGLYRSVQHLSTEFDQRFSHLAGRPRMKRLYSILRNPFYYGDFRWKDEIYKGNVEFQPPIVSYEVWKRAQNVLDGRSKHKVTTKQFHYLDLIRCGGRILDSRGYETEKSCVCLITAEEKRKKMKDGSVKTYFYYHCSNTSKKCSQWDRFHVQSVAGRKTVNFHEAEIEKLFEAVFRPFNWTPELVKRMQEILLEPLIVVREYPFQWKRSAIDRSELAKLRNIEGWIHEEIGRHIGRSRSVVSRLLSDISTKGRRHAD